MGGPIPLRDYLTARPELVPLYDGVRARLEHNYGLSYELMVTEDHAYGEAFSVWGRATDARGSVTRLVGQPRRTLEGAIQAFADRKAPLPAVGDPVIVGNTKYRIRVIGTAVAADEVLVAVSGPGWRRAPIARFAVRAGDLRYDHQGGLWFVRGDPY